MSKRRDHFIICGAGRVGSHLMRSLRATEGTFLVIENDSAKAAIGNPESLTRLNALARGRVFEVKS